MSVFLSTGGSLSNVTSCLAAWSNVPFKGGSLSLVPFPFLEGGLLKVRTKGSWNLRTT